MGFCRQAKLVISNKTNQNQVLVSIGGMLEYCNVDIIRINSSLTLAHMFKEVVFDANWTSESNLNPAPFQ